jgi:uncharacterized membrane-anchored protein YhcB (DUF1043 family)
MNPLKEFQECTERAIAKAILGFLAGIIIGFLLFALSEVVL